MKYNPHHLENLASDDQLIPKEDLFWLCVWSMVAGALAGFLFGSYFF